MNTYNATIDYADGTTSLLVGVCNVYVSDSNIGELVIFVSPFSYYYVKDGQKYEITDELRERGFHIPSNAHVSLKSESH